MSQGQSRQVFVGRQREMAHLTATLEDVLAGQGRLLMLVGEPGIGNTRTAQELGALAIKRGAQVFWGRCYEEEGAPPYWPWVQAIRSYIQQAGTQRLILEMGPGAGAIAEIVGEARVKLPDLEPTQQLEPEQARFRLFDSITTFLKNASQTQPLMLVLDDLHWADRSSLQLPEFLARELGDERLLVVGAYRDVDLSRQHPLSETLAHLSREPVFQRQILRGLDQQDTAPFVEAAVGVRVSRELAETLYAHTEGNPFFLTEVTRLLAERSELDSQGITRSRDVRIPEGVREVIGQRLNRLSEQCNEALRIASLIGREFDFKLLAGLNEDVNEDQLLEALQRPNERRGSPEMRPKP